MNQSKEVDGWLLGPVMDGCWRRDDVSWSHNEIPVKLRSSALRTKTTIVLVPRSTGSHFGLFPDTPGHLQSAL